MSPLLQCFSIYVSVTATFVNAMAQIDVAHELTRCSDDGNATIAAVVCKVNGLKDMNIKRNEHDIAHWPANSVPGQVDSFATDEGHTVMTVVFFASNVTGYVFSALAILPVKVGAHGLGNATCIAEKEKDNKTFSTTWNSGPSESCKTNGRMTLSFGCYNNATVCIFSCRGGVLMASLNGRILSEDLANTTSFECYPENNTCSSELRDFVIIENGMGFGILSEIGVLRCEGPVGYVEVNMGEYVTSTSAPISTASIPTASTPTSATEKSGGRATGVNLAMTILQLFLLVGGCDMPINRGN